ncbi:MAG TPA: oxygen-independent coproporphyrinogen III oxidase [Burkholderiales bacterium]|nr:oxygen-independent coproporphyrinogen III oxidase [Burkholderiales bacterium]
MNATDLIPDADLLRRFDRPGPRYTSYPTADRFVDAYDVATQRRVLEAGRQKWGAKPLSLYVHLPFCNTLCYYCGCNKVITKDHSRAAKYLRYLEREMDLVVDIIGARRHVEQLHWGGGTPTFLSEPELRELMDMLRSRFDFAADGEYSIEIDPRSVDVSKMAVLGEIGFNRASLGVQDFDPDVQKAVNRIQSYEVTERAVNAAREHGFKSVNVDLIYGLPKQNPARFSETLSKTLILRPDRIALYNYAHLPTLFKPQRRIHEADLPSPATRIELLQTAIRTLTDAGYVYIGMDHFASPDDDLAKAQKMGNLHRNFQGYSTRAECDLIAFGVSAISAIGSTYSQNVKSLDEYYDRLDQNELPVMRGIELNADDVLRRAVIQSLMCQFTLSIESLQTAYLIDFHKYFADEMEALREYVDMGMVEIDDEWITVTPKGRLFVRAIAMVFDRYLRQSEMRARYSKVV